MHQKPMIYGVNARHLQLSPKVSSSASRSAWTLIELRHTKVRWTVLSLFYIRIHCHDIDIDIPKRQGTGKLLRNDSRTILCQEPHSPTSASLGPWRGPKTQPIRYSCTLPTQTILQLLLKQHFYTFDASFVSPRASLVSYCH